MTLTSTPRLERAEDSESAGLEKLRGAPAPTLAGPPAEEATPDELGEMRRAFAKADKNGDGRLDADEVRIGLGRTVALCDLLIHCTPGLRTYSVPLFLKRQRDRTPDQGRGLRDKPQVPGRRGARGGDGGDSHGR